LIHDLNEYECGFTLGRIIKVWLSSFSTSPNDAPPVEKKYKPLNTTPNSTKEIKVKIIPAQREYAHSALQLK